MKRKINWSIWIWAFAMLSGICVIEWGAGVGAQTQSALKYKFDPEWPKPLPNKWKMGGVTGLAVDKDNNVWVLDRPNDLRDIELNAEWSPPLADCCTRPPSMIHIDQEGNVIGYFDAPQGHGMAVDSKGFVYIGQDTVRKYDPKTGKVVGETPRAPERQPGGGGGEGGARVAEHGPRDMVVRARAGPIRRIHPNLPIPQPWRPSEPNIPRRRR